MARKSKVRSIFSLSIGILSLLASSLLVLVFGGSDYAMFFLVAVMAYVLAIASLAASWRELRHWQAVILSVAGMNVLVVMPFMLWLHVGIEGELAKASAIALTAVAAFLLASYVRRRTADEETLCPGCRQKIAAQARYCTSCGLHLGEDGKTQPEVSGIAALGQGRLASFGFRFAAGFLDFLLLYVVVGVGLAVAYRSGISMGVISELGSFPLLFASALLYGTVLVGAFAATAGKRALNLRVLRSDGSRVGYGRAFLRELAKFGPLLIISAFMIALRVDRRGLHDLVADTVVIRPDSE